MSQIKLCTYKIAQLINGLIGCVCDDEVMCRPCSSLDRRVRLEIEVLVVWRCDDVVDRGAWVAVFLSIGASVVLWVEPDVVALAADDSDYTGGIGIDIRLDFAGFFELINSTDKSCLEGRDLRVLDVFVLGLAHTVAVVDDSLWEFHRVRGCRHFKDPIFDTLLNHNFHIVDYLS